MRPRVAGWEVSRWFWRVVNATWAFRMSQELCNGFCSKICIGADNPHVHRRSSFLMLEILKSEGWVHDVSRLVDGMWYTEDSVDFLKLHSDRHDTIRYLYQACKYMNGQRSTRWFIRVMDSDSVCFSVNFTCNRNIIKTDVQNRYNLCFMSTEMAGKYSCTTHNNALTWLVY